MEQKTYSIKQELVAQFASAFANPARVAICEFLGQQESCYFGAIRDVVPLSKATVSQHLTTLKDAGLIKCEMKHPKVVYSINKENWELAKELLSKFLDQVVNNLPNNELTDENTGTVNEVE